MAKLVLWGRGTSTNVQKVIWICHEFGLDVDRKIVGGPHGGLETVQFGLINPHRKIPVLEIDQIPIWESHAIMRFVASEFGSGRFYGDTARDQAEVNMWLDWFATTFWPPIRFLFLSVFRDKIYALDHPLAQQQIALLNTQLSLVAKEVAQKGHLVRSEFTLPDISMAIALNRLTGMGFSISLPADLQSYFENVQRRPAYAIATLDDPTK